MTQDELNQTFLTTFYKLVDLESQAIELTCAVTDMQREITNLESTLLFVGKALVNAGRLQN